jgi:hypothetical protein
VFYSAAVLTLVLDLVFLLMALAREQAESSMAELLCRRRGHSFNFICRRSGSPRRGASANPAAEKSRTMAEA